MTKSRDDLNRQALRAAVLRWMDESFDAYLPSGGALAKTLGIRVESLSTVLRELRSEGRLDFRPGQRMRITGHAGHQSRSPASPKRVLRPAEQLAEALRGDILEGRLRSGEALPKMQALALEKRLSPQTVSSAYSRLEEASLVHRRGKRWIVGSKLAIPVPFAGTAPAILILQAHSGSWRKLRNPRTGPFAAEFVGQARQHGIRLLSCVLEKEGASAAACEAIGMDQVKALIRSLGVHYLGAFLVVRRHKSLEPGTVALDLLGYGKPVVWLDPQEDSSTHRLGPLFLRCGFSEELFSGEALEILHRLGHRTVGFCGLRNWEPPWLDRRLSILKSRAKSLRPSMTLLDYRHAMDAFYSQPVSRLEEALVHVHRYGSSRQRKCVDTLFRGLGPRAVGRNGSDYRQLAERITAWSGNWAESPESWNHLLELLPLLLQADLTALIFSHDVVARHFAERIGAMGISVPDELSLVSYDNSRDFTELRVSTMGNGAGNLGYRAFHHLLGRLPGDRLGPLGLLAHPEIDNRGSLGPPDPIAVPPAD